MYKKTAENIVAAEVEAIHAKFARQSTQLQAEWDEVIADIRVKNSTARIDGAKAFFDGEFKKLAERHVRALRGANVVVFQGKSGDEDFEPEAFEVVPRKNELEE